MYHLLIERVFTVSSLSSDRAEPNEYRADCRMNWFVYIPTEGYNFWVKEWVDYDISVSGTRWFIYDQCGWEKNIKTSGKLQCQTGSISRETCTLIWEWKKVPVLGGAPFIKLAKFGVNMDNFGIMHIVYAVN
jgi:hypothetical protein